MPPVKKGRFIVFEGIDGAGKSTQARLLAECLAGCGIECLLTAEPSDGPIGRRIRESPVRLAAPEEARLFTEDRREHVERVVLPALARGVTVICDRYVYSSVAYQGARGVDPAAILEENRRFAPQPDVTFLLDISVDDALARIQTKRGSRLTPFEVRGELEAVALMYRQIDEPGLFRIDALQSPATIHERVIRIIKPICVSSPTCS